MFYEVEDGARKECDFEPTDKFMNVERQATIRTLYEDFYNKCINPDMVQADTRQFELNMLLEGYSMTEIAQFLLDKYSSDDFPCSIGRFVRIEKSLEKSSNRFSVSNQ